MSAPTNLSTRLLPRILSPFETWGFGLAGQLVWVMAIPVIFGLAGEGSLYVWIPASIIVFFLCQQVRSLAKKYPHVTGGVPGYIALLLPNNKRLATYAGLGYYLGWCASFVWIGYIIVETIQSAFPTSLSMEIPATLVALAISLTAFVVGFSSTRILSILQNLFVWTAVGIIFGFTVAGTVYLAQSGTPDFWSGWPTLGAASWLTAMSYALVHVLYLEIGVTMVADSTKPERTADFLQVPAYLTAALFGWGGWVFARVATGSFGLSTASLVPAFETVLGPTGSILAVVLVLMATLLTLNTAVVMLPRTLFEMSKQGLLHPAYAFIDHRGILRNGLGATLLVTSGLTVFGVRALYVAAGFGYVLAYAIFHYALWRNRNQEQLRYGSWLALGLAVFEAGVMAVGAWISSPLVTVLGAGLPLLLLGLDRASRYLPAWRVRFRLPRLLSRYDFEYNQIFTNTFVTGMAICVVIVGLAGVTTLAWDFLVLFGIVSFLFLVFASTAVASWTTIPQIDSLQEVSEELEKVNEELVLDIEKRKKLEAKLARNLCTDDLTRLGNRKMLETTLEKILQRGESDYALMFLDLDRFKVINDSLGHVVGDDLLKAVARRLRKVLGRKRSTTIVRLGGDEFVVLFERVKHTEQVMRQVKQVIEAFEEPLIVKQRKITTTLSVGVVFGEQRYRYFEQLLRDADIAMYRSKLNGRNQFTVFTELMRKQAKQEHLMEMSLRHAVETNDFALRYQPIVDSTTNEVRGYECLLRMKGRNGELISPEYFVDIAEENGLIVPITWWILEQALRDVQTWREGGCDCYVSINLSNRTLAQTDLKERVQTALLKYNIPPRYLNFEVLESAITANMAVVQKNLQLLHRLGVRISIDDFGVGYSNLSRLHELPIDTLKIDRTYVQNLSGHGASIIQTIMDLAQNMGFAVIVEGVEKPQERAQLQTMDCEMMQGYLYAKPMPAVDVVKFTRSLSVVPVRQRHRVDKVQATDY